MEYGGPDLLTEMESHIEDNRQILENWFAEKRAGLEMPIYGSVDVRDAHWKVAVVDANQYPAGFNNLDSIDANSLCSEIAKSIRSKSNPRHIHIWPESHTRNAGYVESLLTLQNSLSNQGFAITIGSPDISVEQADGLTGSVQFQSVNLQDGISVQGTKPDLVLMNNDMTEGPISNLSTPILPPVEMGWYRRRKSDHFRATQPYIDEVAKILGLDPWLLGTHWFVSEDKCLEKDTCRTLLAAEVDDFLMSIQSKYDEYGIEGTPTLFVKNDAGTYGLGILEITSGQELLDLSNRKMNKLTYGKGGIGAEDFLLQEGVPSALAFNGMVIEPVAYCGAGKVAGWFYRANPKKGKMANLNSPSSMFLPTTEVTDESIVNRRKNWHMLVAELSMLGMAAESMATK
ncbi:MAG: glutamate--cysteine ligase [Candidatus Thalassarchaeaceae archaeon]|nr:glutamate--cysteine ligase [Candidatus Thalassarchaeaceae archaeon]